MRASRPNAPPGHMHVTCAHTHTSRGVRVHTRRTSTTDLCNDDRTPRGRPMLDDRPARTEQDETSAVPLYSKNQHRRALTPWLTRSNTKELGIPHRGTALGRAASAGSGPQVQGRRHNGRLGMRSSLPSCHAGTSLTPNPIPCRHHGPSKLYSIVANAAPLGEARLQCKTFFNHLPPRPRRRRSDHD